MKDYVTSLFRNNRFYILTVSVLFSFAVALFINTTITSPQLQIIRTEQIYGLTSFVLLYMALLIGPFCYTFKSFPWNAQLSHARRAIGVSSFYFALLHASISFFKQLGGFEGIGFLDNSYLTAILLGLGGLIILFALAITSVDWAIKKMQFKNWKLLHRFVYLASVAILIHALMLGTHFGNLSNPTGQVMFFALAFLLILEAPRVENWISKNPNPKFGWSTLIVVVLLSSCYFLLFSSFSAKNDLFDIHSEHKQIAQEVNQNKSSLNTFPGMVGDRNLRYTVSFDKSEKIQTNQDTKFTYKIYDAASGNPVTLFRTFYEKPMHMLVVDNTLSFFRHIHPTLQTEGFTVTTRFPEDGMYRTYLQYQPWNAIEQQVAFAFHVGEQPDEHSDSTQPIDSNLTKTFGAYEVTLSSDTPLNAEAMTFGKQTIKITVRDAQTKQPITNLKPYLAAFGHMSMIKQDSYDFIHIHPADLTPPQPNENGGPTVDFLPIGIYGKFKPGIYRMFVELNPNGKLFTADFTVKVN